MATFPIDVSALYGSYTRGAPTRAVVRTQMEVGEPKVRRRSSKGLYMIAASYAISSGDLTAFQAWYRDDAGMGAISFEWTDPRNGVVRVVRFAEGGYTIAQIAPTTWQLAVQLEEWV